MIALKGNNYINNLHRLKVEVSEHETPSLLERLYFYFRAKKTIKRLQRVNQLLKASITDLDNPQLVVDEEKYLTSKDILVQVKEIAEEAKKLDRSQKLIQSAVENVSLAYKLEKLSRMKFYSTKPKQETTEYAKGMSSISLAFAGKNI
jgi:hypothetical protein